MLTVYHLFPEQLSRNTYTLGALGAPVGQPAEQPWPPDARQRAPLMGLAPGEGPSFPCPGKVAEVRCYPSGFPFHFNYF